MGIEYPHGSPTQTPELERIIRPIVEGQIRGFVIEHPEVLNAVDWFKPRKDRTTTFVNSLAKRIVRDLCCKKTAERIVAACGEGHANPSNTDEAGTDTGLLGK